MYSKPEMDECSKILYRVFRILRQSACCMLFFGHEYKKVGNQHIKYLKCIKCGKKLD